MKNKPNKLLFWTPRILSILFIILIFLFSLDVFDSSLSFWQTVLALFMHNIPTIILIIILLISWRYGIVGGIAFILAGIIYIGTVISNEFEWFMLSWVAVIAIPAFIIGILYILDWMKRR